MESISVTKFKAQCLALIERVQVTGEPITITKHGKPAVVVSVPPKPEPKKSQLGCLKGKMKIVGDIISPLPPEFYKSSDGPY